MTEITRADLMELIYRHYPRGLLHIARVHVPPGAPVYEDTEEHLRLVEAAKRGRTEYPTWNAMIGRLAARYNVQNESVFLLAGGITPAYAARIYYPADSEAGPPRSSRAPLSFHVSLLGPYYGIHDMDEPDEKHAIIAAEIEATYPGYRQIPPEIGNEVVPGIAAEGGLFDKTTIYLCLFSEVWRWVEPPDVQFKAWLAQNA